MKLKLKLNSHYDDKLVKGNFGDEVKANVKPGATAKALFIGQGCKKNKGEPEEPNDYAHCISCGLTVSISVSK